MKGGTRIAIGVGIGYVLGRTRKMRFALSLAGAAMAKRSSGMPGELLERGTSMLKSSPELAQLSDTVRGELAGAVRSAAVTAATNGIDALNTRLQQGPTPDRDRSREADSGEDQAGEEASWDTGEASAGEDADVENRTESGTGRDDEEHGEQPTARARAARPRATRSRTTAARTADRRSGSAASTVRRRSRAETDGAPVHRTRR